MKRAHVGLASVLATQVDTATGREHLEKTVDPDPEYGVAGYRLAQVDRRFGKCDEQQKALREFAHLRGQPAA